jgi:predicted transcriptional regulator
VRITEETLRALVAIAHFGEGTFVQIRTRSGLQAGSLSSILKRLEADGWVANRKEMGRAGFGKPLRQFYRIADEETVRKVAATMRDLAVALLEDLA